MQRTKIEYLTHTWNPIAMRCTPVGPGCEHCWHLRMADRLKMNPALSDRGRAAYAGEYDPWLDPRRLHKPTTRKQPAVVGVQFMGDLFHDSVTDFQIMKVWKEMEVASWHTFLVLTKRPGRMETWITDRWKYSDYPILKEDPLPNVWLGTSVENQKWADLRIPALYRSPAAAYWLSIEPMLGPIEFPKYLSFLPVEFGVSTRVRYLEWMTAVVVGGESGPGSRPMHPDWVRSIRDQCVEAGVPFVFKQWGDWAPTDNGLADKWGFPGVPIKHAVHLSGEVVTEWSRWDTLEPYPIVRVGKKAAGHLLDGKEWRDIPGLST